MKIEELIIDGFKSYATRTVISDWDPQFNAITGLNGSGKSNILDAICFVLGISSMSTVRASNIQDLIYKRGQAGITKASVTIVFDNTDRSNSPIGFNNSPKISVTRQIVLGGTSKYLINGHRAPQQSVLQLFQSVQLNINNPNFLIMQGKITKVLNMKPTEILSLIEEAAGTKMFEDRREKAERTMAKKETKLQENRTLLAEEIEPKLEKLKNEKRIFLEFQTTQTDLEKTTKVVIAFDYHNISNKYDNVKENTVNSEERMQELKKLISKTSDEIASLKEDLENIKMQKKDEFDKNGTLAKLEKKEGELLSELSRLKATQSITSQNLKENEKTIENLKNTEASLNNELNKKLSDYKNTEVTYEHVSENLNKLKAIHKNKSELLSTLSTGISSNGETDHGYNAQLLTAKDSYNEISVAIQTLMRRIEMMKRELTENGPRLKQAQKENEQHVLDVKKCQDTCEELNKELGSFGFDPEIIKVLKKEEAQLKQKLHKLRGETEHLRRRVTNLEFQYTKPNDRFNPESVKGVAAQLFTLDEKNFDSATALQVCAGGRLYNVVVDNEQTASQLLERGRLRKRVTIIPLNKIAARTINANVLNVAKNIAPGRVELALNLIGYEEEVTKAMEFIFGSSLICMDAETSKLVTFHPQIRTRSITLDGDVYDPEGTLSGGSRNSSNSLLIDIQKYNRASNNIKIVENRLHEVIFQIKQQIDISQKTKHLQKDLEIANHRLTLTQKNLESDTTSQLLKRNEELQESIDKCSQDIKEKESTRDHLAKDIEKIQKDAEEFSKDKGSKLKELKKEIEVLSKQVNEEEHSYENNYDLYQNLQFETEQLTSEIETTVDSLKQMNDSLVKLKSEKTDVEFELKETNEKLSSIQLELDGERKRLLSIDDELKELESLVKVKTDQKLSYDLESQKLQHDLNKFKGSSTALKSQLDTLITDNEWLKDKSQLKYVIEQHPNINLEEYRERADHLEELFQDMRRKINPNIMSMIESVEKKETALKTMIRTIEKDKVKIQETITKLNEYKRETLIKTWEQVTKDFGNIFADLLPNSFAKLVPCQNKDVTEGLEVKVKLGNLWKESLVELSGGQRSLIALSLIMALLQYRPAPMYILDEVDAALDLSHTQNIGHLIKTRFKGSQFIVVSLKEGMFTNANRVFRTRFQNGTSVVSIM